MLDRCFPFSVRLAVALLAWAPLGAMAANNPADNSWQVEEEETHGFDLIFAFVTPEPELSEESNNGIPLEPPVDLEDDTLLSGEDILKRLDERHQKEQAHLMENQPLAALFQHPASGKSVELQLAMCETLDFAHSEGPFTQQVQCGSDLYSYSSSNDGLDILVNGEVFFSMPLDPGHYRVNGVAFDIE